MRLDASVADGQDSLTGADVVPSFPGAARVATTGFATGLSFSTTTSTVVLSLRFWFVPVTVIRYVPAAVGFGSVRRRFVPVAVQPSRLVESSEAFQPPGTPLTDRATRSKKVLLRPTVIGTTTAPPASPTGAGVSSLTSNVPRGPSRDTSSSFSCLSSGSVVTFQSRLPRYWSASFTWAGVAYGRLAL